MIQMKLNWLAVTLVATLLLSAATPHSAFAKVKELKRSTGKLSAKTAQRAPASISTGSTEVDKPLKVQGQSRNLSMMLVRKGEKDKIKFGEIRETYREEILKTHF